MSTDPKATKSWFRFQFSLASLVFMSVMAGVLLLVNFRENENWLVRYAPVNPNYGDPATRHLSTFHTKGAYGYGWPYLVQGESEYGETAEWSWMGLCGNIVIGGAVLFLLGVLFEAIWRWNRKRAPFQFTRREGLALAVCVIALLALSWRVRNINVFLGNTYLVDVYSARGWPWAWYSERIAHEVPPNTQLVANLPIRTGFSVGEVVSTSLVLDLFIGALICGAFARFLIWLRRFRSSSSP